MASVMSLEMETPVWGITSVLGRFEQQVVWENFRRMSVIRDSPKPNYFFCVVS